MAARRRSRSSRVGPHGVVCIDKPVGPTSFSVMRAVQRRLGSGKAGHAGTLDPAASGLLVVLLGEATKLSDWLMSTGDKEYLATIALGTATDTCDAEGRVIAQSAVGDAARDPAAIRAALCGFIGVVQQLPPRYAAIKKEGRSLMSRARAGETFTVEPRTVTCHDIELISVTGDAIALRVRCGKGYYVRALARDLGGALGVPAHLAALRRTRSSGFDLSGAVGPDEVSAQDVVPIDQAVPEACRVVIAANQVSDVMNGRPIDAAGATVEQALLLDDARTPLALARRTPAGTWKVARGFRFEAS